MVAGVGGIAMSLYPHRDVGVLAKPRRLRLQKQLRLRRELGASIGEIDGGAARLGREIGAQHIKRILDGHLGRRSAAPEAGQLRGRRYRDQSGEQENKLAHQSIVPDQLGSEPSCGTVIFRGALPSRFTREMAGRPLASVRWNTSSRLLAAQ